MTDLLEKIAEGEEVTTVQCDNLVVNRRRRERRRRAFNYQLATASVLDASVEGEAEARYRLSECEAICGPIDFELLLRRALGFSYGEMAFVMGASNSAMKVRVHRARKKVMMLAA